MAQLVSFLAGHRLHTILHHNMITFAQGTWLLMEKAQHQQSQQEIGHGPSADSLLLQLLRSLLHFEFSSLSLGVVKIQKQLRSQDRKKTPIINLLHIGPAFYLMNVSHQVLRISNSSTRASITKLLLVGSSRYYYYSAKPTTATDAHQSAITSGSQKQQPQQPTGMVRPLLVSFL